MCIFQVSVSKIDISVAYTIRQVEIKLKLSKISQNQFKKICYGYHASETADGCYLNLGR